MPLLPHGSSLLVRPRAEDAQGLPRGCSTAAPHQQAHSRMVAQLSPSSCQDLSPSITSLVASGPLAGARGTTIPPQQKWHHGSCSRLCVGLQHCSDRFFHYFLLGRSLSAFPRLSLPVPSPHLSPSLCCAPARDLEGEWEHEDLCLPRSWDTGAGLSNPDTKLSQPGAALGWQSCHSSRSSPAPTAGSASTTVPGAPAKPRTQEQGDPRLTPPCSTLPQTIFSNPCFFFPEGKTKC